VICPERNEDAVENFETDIAHRPGQRYDGRALILDDSHALVRVGTACA